jgi:hypothetical protein
MGAPAGQPPLKLRRPAGASAKAGAERCGAVVRAILLVLLPAGSATGAAPAFRVRPPSARLLPGGRFGFLPALDRGGVLPRGV